MKVLAATDGATGGLMPRGDERCAMTKISARDLARRLDADERPVVLDVRRQGARAGGRIPGSVATPVDVPGFERRVAEAAPDLLAPVVVCDDDPADTSDARAVRRLVELGYTDVAELDGGLAAWMREDLPLEAP